jgi:membrane-bound metal-dependent hydrolase YbcI (DUF457 family)
MDNVTHTLFALTLARTPLGRRPGATIALVLASNAPDTDIVAALGGSANYLAWHRGPTHGPLGVVGLGLVTAAIVWGAQRFFSRAATSPADADRASFASLAAVSMVGILAHILMDLPTSYGTRLLSPFSWRWFTMDLLPIIDIYLLIILVAGLVLGRGSAARRRTAAIVALVLMAANYGVRIVTHQQALAKAGMTFGPRLPPPCDPRQAFRSLVDSWPRVEPASGGSCLVETAAIPTFLSPFHWRVIAQLRDGYEIYDSIPGPPARISNVWTPLVTEAARTPTAQVLLGFSRFPVARIEQDAAGQRVVQFTDMRFDIPLEPEQPPSRRSALFTVTVTFGPGGSIVQERLGD